MKGSFGVILGIDNAPDGSKIYRVMDCNYIDSPEDKTNLKWKFNCLMMTEPDLINVLSNNTFINAVLVNGKIKGKGASLDRFKGNGKSRPVVILSQIINNDKKVIGYKIATYNGEVRSVNIKEMIGLGIRAVKKDLIPVQNAIFVPGEEGQARTAHYKAYSETPFLVETAVSQVNKYKDTRRVDIRKNEKNIAKSVDAFNAEQMNQLKLGKEHKVDIRIYANPELEASKMKILREGLEKKLNVKPFAFPEYTEASMMYYIDLLENDIDIRSFVNPEYNYQQIFQLGLAESMGLDVSKLSNPKLSAQDMSEIAERLELEIWKDELVKKDGSWV